MSKKKKKKKLKSVSFERSNKAHAVMIQAGMDRLIDQFSDKDYGGVIDTCRRLLSLPRLAPSTRGEVLHYLGQAHLVLQHFDEAYQTLSEALTLPPEDSYLWNNRGIACLYTMRSGQAVRDLERAIELEGRGSMARRFSRRLKETRQMVQENVKLRGPHFTLDQLIEQEELFQQGMGLLEAKQWQEAEQTLRRVIEMGDVLPQPWGNLGMCLTMQRRYDEAEAALRRALELQPDYDHALENLEVLEHVRQTDRPDLLLSTITHPLEGKDLKLSVEMIEEE